MTNPYRPDETIIRLANELAVEHACTVHVGRFVNEDTGETSPAFSLDPMPIIDGERLAVSVEEHRARFSVQTNDLAL